MKKKYIVRLSTEERDECEQVIKKLKGSASVARAYVKRIDFIYTPKHGSWLNIAECELSAMTRQCLQGRRLGHLSELQRELEAWATQTNDKQRIVDWQFQIDDARSKLKRLYPTFKPG